MKDLFNIHHEIMKKMSLCCQCAGSAVPSSNPRPHRHFTLEPREHRLYSPGLFDYGHTNLSTLSLRRNKHKIEQGSVLKRTVSVTCTNYTEHRF